MEIICFKESNQTSTWLIEINIKLPLLNTHIGKAPKSSASCSTTIATIIIIIIYHLPV